MTSLEYYRPQTLDEAPERLNQGTPLAGGPRRKQGSAYRLSPDGAGACR